MDETLVEQNKRRIEVTESVGAESVVAGRRVEPLGTTVSRLPLEGIGNGYDEDANLAGLGNDPAASE